ncbi:MAG: BON domain-containing protein [Thermodesulfobacteriota bacterium]
MDDERIKKDIVDELFWDGRIDASDITVRVDGGIVTLSGEVPAFEDISAARDAAWSILGVVDVIDNLVVNFPTPPGPPTDDELEEMANNTLEWNTLIDASKVKASAAGGLVTLEGTVDAHWKKSYAESLISGMQGIINVENRLAVAPTESFTDEAIADDLVSAMTRDVMVDQDKITVEVKDNTVTLTGSVPSWTMAMEAEKDASRTPGVVEVHNELGISQFT